MRIVVAPDKFAGTLSAVEAAAAIAEGWSRRAPHDELVRRPMSDGGPGFVAVLHACLGGELVACTTTDPYGHEVPGAVLVVDDADDAGRGAPAGRGRTAYVESAQAIGLHLTEPAHREPLRATSAGLGGLLRAALDAGATRVVVGLGGSAVDDGGVGLLASLGARGRGADGAPLDLTAGPAGLEGLEHLDLGDAAEAWGEVDLVVASDVDNPLLGLFGATKTYGPQKGLTEEQLPYAEGRLIDLVAALDAGGAPGTATSRAEGAGAAGGAGFALLLLGGRREPGIALVAEAVGLAAALEGADLVVTGEGAFDFSSRSGKVPYGVARAAEAGLVPCVALAGQVLVGARETRALGIEAAYGLVDLVGEERAFADPRGSLAALAERTARTWSRR